MGGIKERKELEINVRSGMGVKLEKKRESRMIACTASKCSVHTEFLTLLCSFTCTLASVKTRTTSTCPFKDAAINGVHPN